MGRDRARASGRLCRFPKESNRNASERASYGERELAIGANIGAACEVRARHTTVRPLARRAAQFRRVGGEWRRVRQLAAHDGNGVMEHRGAGVSI